MAKIQLRCEPSLHFCAVLAGGESRQRAGKFQSVEGPHCCGQIPASHDGSGRTVVFSGSANSEAAGGRGDLPRDLLRKGGWRAGRGEGGAAHWRRSNRIVPSPFLWVFTGCKWVR